MDQVGKVEKIPGACRELERRRRAGIAIGITTESLPESGVISRTATLRRPDNVKPCQIGRQPRANDLLDLHAGLLEAGESCTVTCSP